MTFEGTFVRYIGYNPVELVRDGQIEEVGMNEQHGLILVMLRFLTYKPNQT